MPTSTPETTENAFVPEDIQAGLWSADDVERGRAADAARQFHRTEWIPDLHRLLEDPEVLVRFKAACALAEFGDVAGVEVLVWALGHRDLCSQALEALHVLGPTSACPALQRFVHRRFLHPLERLQAAAALARCGGNEGLALVREKLSSSKPEERGFALELLGRLQVPEAREWLEKVVRDPADSQRLDALRGLVALADPLSLPLLKELAGDRHDLDLAETARDALSDLDLQP